ncbi:MAG: hypothetical protein IJM78_04005 [Prevotella sp.]|nr:hypothetical protein [Prevotella sp.]
MGHVESYNRISIKDDTYNFEMHNLSGGIMNVVKESVRNVETTIGGWLHGNGTPFDIRFNGYYRNTDGLHTSISTVIKNKY